MKKRSLIVVLIMAMVLSITACGAQKQEQKDNPFVGTWTGTLDLTEYVETTIAAGNADLQKYAQFEDLTFTLTFTFTEDKLSLHLDDASAQQFITNAEAGIVAMVDAMVADVAAANNVTAEDVYAGMSVTRETYIISIVESMKLDEMVKSMAEALELNGAYQYDAEKIIVIYDDKTYEEMKYVKGIEDITITVSDGTNEFAIPCTKSK